MTADFDEYVAAHSGGLLRLAYLLEGEPQRAEDLVQESLLKAFRRWDRIGGLDQPHSYVRRIVVNQHLSWRRRRRESELPRFRVPDVPVPSGEDAVGLRDLAWRLVRQLPARQRGVLVLRYYEDLDDREIAEVLGIAPGTVRSLASRAFAGLRAHPALADHTVPALEENR